MYYKKLHIRGLNTVLFTVLSVILCSNYSQARPSVIQKNLMDKPTPIRLNRAEAYALFGIDESINKTQLKDAYDNLMIRYNQISGPNTNPSILPTIERTYKLLQNDISRSNRNMTRINKLKRQNKVQQNEAYKILGVGKGVDKERLQNTYKKMGLITLMQINKDMKKIKPELRNLYYAYKTLSMK